MSSAPRDDAIVARPISEPGKGGVNARRWKRITYSPEFLLAVGSSEACKKLPAGIDVFERPDEATQPTPSVWVGETRLQHACELTDSLKAAVQTGSKPCTKFFSTAGCSFGENCHFIHNFPGGYQAAAKASDLQDNPAPVRAPGRIPIGRVVADGPPTPTVKPARPCHSAHDESELGIGKRHMSTVDNSVSTPPLMDQRPAGHRAPQPTTPNRGTATPAQSNFGASAKAKISVDASLTDAIIGRDGANIKQISRASGAKLRIMNHESDPSLKNLEPEGTFDQIKDANSMVTGMLIAVRGGDAPPPAGGSQHSGGQCSSFKTKPCGHFARGSCSSSDRCHFAHGESELRIVRDHESDPSLKNLELEGTFDQIKDRSGTVTAMLIPGGHAPSRTLGGQRHSFKTKLCGAFTRGYYCSFGDGCRFAHGEGELRIRDDPEWDLGLKNIELEGMFDNTIKDYWSMATAGMLPGGGNAPPPSGGLTYGAEGLRNSSFKTKLCGHLAKGFCSFGDGCRFAHGESELRIGDRSLDDPRVKNLELGRALDQIRDAMVIGMLIRVGVGGNAPPPWRAGAGGSLHEGRRQWHSFKAKLCEHFPRGSCIFGDRCHFAHGEGELRKPASAAARDPSGW